MVVAAVNVPWRRSAPGSHMTRGLYPTAITGTWTDHESTAWYVYENSDPGAADWQLAEAVLVMLGTEAEEIDG